MRRLMTAVVCASFLAIPLLGQAQSNVEIFGGYQFLHSGNFDGTGDSVNTNGWNASATFKFREHLGVAADFSGNYRSKTNPAIHIYTYTFGPVVSVNSSRNVSLFAHVLLGGARSPTGCYIFSGSPNECHPPYHTGFAVMVGGGVDARAGKHISLRLAQIDWVDLPSQLGQQRSNVRISTGVVFRF